MYSSDENPAERANREKTETNDPNETQRNDFFNGFQHKNNETEGIVDLITTMKEEGLKGHSMKDEITLGINIEEFVWRNIMRRNNLIQRMKMSLDDRKMCGNEPAAYKNGPILVRIFICLWYGER